MSKKVFSFLLIASMFLSDIDVSVLVAASQNDTIIDIVVSDGENEGEEDISKENADEGELEENTESDELQDGVGIEIIENGESDINNEETETDTETELEQDEDEGNDITEFDENVEDVNIEDETKIADTDEYNDIDIHMLEAAIDECLSEVSEVVNMDVDSFEETYGLSYENLFYQCPEYLNNETMNNLLSRLVDACIKAEDDVSESEKNVAAFMDGLKNGTTHIFKYIASQLGLTGSTYTDFKDKMAGELVKEYCNIGGINADIEEIHEKFTLINKAVDLSDKAIREAYIMQLNEAAKNLSDEQVKKIVDGVFADEKNAAKIIKYTDDTLDFFTIITSITELQEIELEIIDDLILMQTEVGDTELLDSLVRIRTDITSNIVEYVVSTYCTDKVLKKISETITNSLYDAMNIGSAASAIAKIAMYTVSTIYEKFNPSVSDIVYTAIMHNYYNCSSIATSKYYMNFLKGEGSSSDIKLYEEAYTFELTCLKLWMKKAKGCTNDKAKLSLLNRYSWIGTGSDSTINYDNYIKLCMKAAAEDIKNGKLVISESGVTNKTDDGTVIDDNYDSTESISKRFEVIQGQYPPNAGKTWKDNWGGASQCFGFARMVFSKLYGVEMSKSYNSTGKKRYEYVNKTNVVQIGQISDSAVTASNIKKLLTQGKLGDIIQGYGTPYGQHTMVLVGTTDSGATVYYCNESGECGIYQKTYTWAQMESRYGTGDSVSDNGITLYRASNYASIYGNGDNLFYDDSVNFIINDGVLVQYKGWQKIVDIPDTVKEIGEKAFYNNNTMTYVNIPDSVTKIGNSAFYGCKSLLRVEIPDSVVTIGAYAFSGCTNLAYVSLSKNITSIGHQAFYNCDALKTIEIPKSLESTSYGASNSSSKGVFSACDGLKDVSFEEGTTEIASNLFANCPGIEEITIPSTVTIIENYAFYNCQNLSNVSIPDSVTKIDTYAFGNCANLDKISIPDSVTEIGNLAFSGCTRLSSVTLSNNLTQIGAEIFKNSGVSAISIPEGVISIGNYAFQNCTSLAEVTLPSSLKSIGNYAFYDCDALTAITIPDSVTSLGTYIFAESELLSDVTLGNGITTIPSYAFNLCPSLRKIVIPYRVTEIKGNAFTNCTALTEITIPRSVTSIASGVFSYPSKLTIYGISGTYAETYANSIGVAFVNKEVKATSVSLKNTELKIAKGVKGILTLNIAPSDFTDEVVWKSTDESIVSVDNNGVVNAKSLGTATIKVTVGELSASCKITVTQPVTSISLNKTALSLEAFESDTLTAEVSPSTADNKAVIWSSSDEEIASVDENGLVTAHVKGSATIKAEAQDGSGVYKECIVTVVNNGYICSNENELESEHNYPVNSSDFWIYTRKGAEKLCVTFDSRTDIEENFDYLYIYDAQGKEVGKYTGTQLAGQVVEVEGDTVKIKLVSDDSGTTWGFKVTSITTTGNTGGEEPGGEDNTEDLKIIFTDEYVDENGNYSRTYTGSAIKPEIEVTNNGYLLTDGVDYTVKYSNNIKAAKCTDRNAPKVTVTGKGNYSGSTYASFTIEPKDIRNEDYTESEVLIGGMDNEDNTIVVASGTKLSPVIVYNGMKLGSKDYELNKAGEKFTETTPDKTVKITGKGNYTGEVALNVKVKDKADLIKFTVSVDTNTKFTYNGDIQEPKIKVITSGNEKKDITEEYGAYYISYGGDRTSAGTQKFTVIGLGLYSGAVSKTYKIQPVKTNIIEKELMSTSYEYVSTGVRFAEGDLKVTDKTFNKELAEGIDYKVTYSGNKKVGTAKYKITFIGNYKGTKAVTDGTFRITQSVLEDYNSAIRVNIPDKVCKAGANCKSAPYVTVNGVTVKASEYIVTYSTDYGATYSASPKADFTNGDAAPVYVKITAKGDKNYMGGLTGEYTVWNKESAGKSDISKAKVAFYALDDRGNVTGTRITKLPYTGEPIELKPAQIKLTIGNAEVPEYAYDYTIVNNLNKGKAVVIIKVIDDIAYMGSKTAAFSIVAKKFNN